MRLDEIKSEPLVLYHGDNVGTTALQPKFMFHGGNNQEGVGIYFGTLEVAQRYGTKICKTVLTSMRGVVYSRVLASKKIQRDLGAALISRLNQTNDDFWYLFTDYGFEVQTKQDVTRYNCYDLFDKMKISEIRNFQIELCQACDNTEKFVEAWNALIPIKGLYDPSTQFFCFIDPKIKVTPVNF